MSTGSFCFLVAVLIQEPESELSAYWKQHKNNSILKFLPR